MMRILAKAAFLVVVALAAGQASAEEPPPCRDAVAAGGLLFLSGQIGIAPPHTDPLADGMDAAASSAMDHVQRVLRAHGRDLTDVVKCTVMLDDIRAWSRFNQTYVRYFEPDALPARSAFATRGLAFGALVEVECIARLPQ